MTSSYEYPSNSSTFLVPIAAVSCVVFFDEIDSIAPARGMRPATEGVVSQILTEMDGIIKLDGAVVRAATNRLDVTDPALLRSGRFYKIIQIPNPDGEKRKKILEVNLDGRHLRQDINNEKIAKTITESFSGSDTAVVVILLSRLCRIIILQNILCLKSPSSMLRKHA